MNIRRMVLDVDKAITRPPIIDLAQIIETVAGVQAVNVTVTEIDIETVGMNITVEGEGIDHAALMAAIEKGGAVVNSIDQVVSGDRLIENVPRAR
jgi:uncharacterized protein